MSTNHLTDSLLAGIYEVRSSWGWYMFLGILLLLLGAICIIGNVAATFVTVIALGWFLIFSGVVALIHAFRVHAWGSGFVVHLLSALLRGFMGYLLIRYPGSGAVTLTLLLSFFLIVGGLFRAIAAGTLKFPRWGWSVLSGVVSLVLGVVLLAEMPVSSLWFIGFVIGMDMIFEGASLVGFATALHHIPDVTAPYRAA